MIENVIANLIASAIGAIILYIGGKLMTDFYFLQLSIVPKDKDDESKTSDEEQKEKAKKKSKVKIRIIRKLPWRHAYKYAKKAVDDMYADSFVPTFIVGIGRGGAIYGSIISYMMGEKPMIALDRLYEQDEQEKRLVKRFPVGIPASWLSKVLLVAGEYHSGDTMAEFKEWLRGLGAERVRTCVLYNQEGYPGQIGKPDYIGISKKRDCLLPWQEKYYLRTWKNPKDAKRRESGLKELVPEGFERSFFLMRHAVTNANAKDQFIGSGSPEEDINFEGRAEAENVGRYLKETVGKLDIIYCSPMKRCRKTAEVIQNIAGGEIKTDENLIEADFGGWEGKLRDELPQAEYDLYKKDQTYHIPGSKDTYATIKGRADAFLDFIRGKSVLNEKNVLVVTHKTLGRVMVQTIEGKEDVHYRSIPMENASLRRIIVTNSGMEVAYYIRVLDGMEFK